MTKENSEELEPSNHNSSKHSSKGHKTQHSWAQGHLLVLSPSLNVDFKIYLGINFFKKEARKKIYYDRDWRSSLLPLHVTKWLDHPISIWEIAGSKHIKHYLFPELKLCCFFVFFALPASFFLLANKQNVFPRHFPNIFLLNIILKSSSNLRLIHPWSYLIHAMVCHLMVYSNFCQLLYCRLKWCFINQLI